MPGYDTHTRTLRLGGLDYRIRSLADLQQFADPDNHAQLLGISSAQWSLFGHVWPAGRLLAEAMATHDVAGKRILELGCGLGLASLVLRRRGADVVRSEEHTSELQALMRISYAVSCLIKTIRRLHHALKSPHLNHRN